MFRDAIVLETCQYADATRLREGEKIFVATANMPSRRDSFGMMKKLIQLASNIYAAVVGGGIFLLSLLALNLSIPVAITVGIAGYFVTGLLIFPAKSPGEQQQKMLKTVLKDGERKLAQIHASARNIQQPEMRRKIGRICEIGHKIFEIVAQHPENVRSAQQFSVYYLETTENIISKYLELSEHKAYSTEVQTSLKKVERMVDQIHGAFEKQLSLLLRDDVLDLDTELSVLQETIDIEKL